MKPIKELLLLFRGLICFFFFFFFSSYFLALHYDYGLTSVLKLVVNYLAGVARWQIEKWEYKVVILTWLDMEFQE